jgi:hypothetical protein
MTDSKFTIDTSAQQETRSVYLELPFELHQRFKALARDNNISMQRLGQQMIRHCVDDLESRADD